MSGDHAEIAAILDTYFDGFYEGDIDKLKSVFHPNCHLYNAMAGDVTDDDMEAVYARVSGRVRPSVRGDAKEDGILTIDQSAPECAFAKVYICLGDRHFTDYLTLLKIDGAWRIIGKTFTGIEREGTLPL